jgi:hypothetical protein
VSARAIPIALAGAAGVSAWLSLGAVAVTDAVNRTRVGILPSPWVLALAVVAFVGVVLATRPSVRRVLPLALVLLLWLPWLPGRVPAAFLIWSGPVAWLVWAAVALGLAEPGLKRAAAAAWLADPRRAPWLAMTLAAACYLVGAGMLRDRVPAGDEPHYLVITQSLLGDGDLKIENNHASGDYAAYFSGELKPDYLKRGLDGQIYSIHAPGASVLVLPAFAVAGYPGALLTIVLVVAAAMAALWIVAWRMTSSASAAWVAWASVALTTPMFFHAFTIYPDGAGAACTVAGLWLLVSLETGHRAGRRTLDRYAAQNENFVPVVDPHSGPRRAERAEENNRTSQGLRWTGYQVQSPWLVAVGAALAAMPWLHTRFAIVAGLLGGAIALRLLWPGQRPAENSATTPGTRARDAAGFLVLPVVAALGWFGYFGAIWGTPNPAVPYGGYTQSAIAHLWPGLTGLMGDQQFGLLTSAPIYLGAIAGMLPLARRHLRLTLEIALLTVTYTIAVASYTMWWGGFSAPARFLVVILPVAGLPLAALWQACRTTAARAIVLVVLLISLALVLPRVFAHDGALLYNGRDGFDLLLDWGHRSVNLPLAFPSAHRDAPGTALADVVTWIAAFALCLTLAWLAASRRGGEWTLACLGLAISAMVAATLVWARHGASAITPSTSSMNLLHEWRAGWHTVGWESRPWHLLPGAEVPIHLQFDSGVRGAQNSRDTALFRAPLIPAGDYELVVSGSNKPAGEISVLVGRTELVLDRMGLEGYPAGPTGLVLHLPVRVHSLTILGDDDARRSISQIELRPRKLRDETASDTTRFGLRATRYGAARVFFLDNNAFMEPGGFWTRGESSTEVVIDGSAPGSPPSLLVRAGAVQTTTELISGDWAESLRLSPGEERHVQLPALHDADAWLVEIVTSEGFRPAQHDPGSRDMRNLGVWVVPD